VQRPTEGGQAIEVGGVERGRAVHACSCLCVSPSVSLPRRLRTA
jgi:hypothetical protein